MIRPFQRHALFGGRDRTAGTHRAGQQRQQQ